MTKRETDELSLGIYRLHWKSGGASIAAVGMKEDGSKWMAPTNWVYPSVHQAQWRTVLRAEKLRWLK